MITKEIIQKYVFNKPEPLYFIWGLGLITFIFMIMLVSVTFLENESLIIGFIASGILIGISLTITKNIFFPIGIILIYNLTITFQRTEMFGFTTDLFETIIRSIGDALFIVFVVYWVVICSQYVLAKIKRLSNPKDEPVTTNKFILGSIIAGFLYGTFMVIQMVSKN